MSSIKNLKLFPFQEEAVVQAYCREGLHVVYDAGTGKSVIAIATAAVLLDDGLVDNVLLVCERNKLGEWEDEFGKFTTLNAMRYHGSNRKRKIEKQGIPDVLITTYETCKADVASFEKQKRGRKIVDGELLGSMVGKRWLVLYDEAARLSNRSSGIYKAHAHMLKRIRNDGGARVIGFTATPIERDWENAFNQLRLVAPEVMPKIGEFESRFVNFRDPFGRAKYRHSRMAEFVEMAQRAMIRKRKTDPDVMDQFPKMIEEAKIVDLHTDHRKLYDLCREVFTGEDGEPLPGSNMLLRQLVGHPASIIHSASGGTSELAQAIVDGMGEESLRGIPSAKTQALMEHLSAVCKGQGEKVVVFTFFGQSVLPELASELRESGYEVFEYHGGLSPNEAERTIKEFRAFDGECIFLSSDSGAQGINLPEATYVIEYESALTFAKRTQRINRINRLTSDSPSVHCLTLVAKDTVEESIVQNMLERNAMLDKLNGDHESEHHVSAAERSKIFQ